MAALCADEGQVPPTPSQSHWAAKQHQGSEEAESLSVKTEAQQCPLPPPCVSKPLRHPEHGCARYDMTWKKFYITRLISQGRMYRKSVNQEIQQNINDHINRFSERYLSFYLSFYRVFYLHRTSL